MAEQLYNLIDVEPPKKLSVTAPEINVIANATDQVGSDVPPPEFQFSPLQTISNIPQSGYNLGKGFYDMLRHPIDTVSSLGKIAAGTVTSLEPNFIPRNQAANAENEALARGVGNYYKDRIMNPARTLQEDPIGALFDLSTILSGGGGAALKLQSAAGRTGGALGKVAETASTAGNITNPLFQLGKGYEKVSPHLFGTVTGTGAETVKGVYEASKQGVNNAINQILEKSNVSDVLNKAQQGLQKMISNKNIEYQTAKTGWAADNTRLSFAPIKTAYQDAKNSIYLKGETRVEPEELKSINRVGKILDDWEKKPSLHTAVGYDFLKQKIDAVYPDSPKMTQAQRIIEQTRNAVKDHIIQNAPEYQTAMRDYEDAIGTINDIKSSFSLNTRASKETALKKLLNTTKDKTGIKLSLADKMKESTGIDIAPDIAGANMRGLYAENLLGQAGGVGGIYNAVTAGINPVNLLGIAATSPKAVGLLTHAAGKVARYAKPIDLTARTGVQLAKVPKTNGLLDAQQLMQELNQLYPQEQQ
jgi:hypothetical protein